MTANARYQSIGCQTQGTLISDWEIINRAQLFYEAEALLLPGWCCDQNSVLLVAVPDTQAILKR